MEHIDNKEQLIDYFFKGSKKKSQLRIGTEHEKFLFNLKKKILYLTMAKLVFQKFFQNSSKIIGHLSKKEKIF